ncbi:hypothetical protein AKJ09_10754 [Labilithrix luteola]|uniref:Uncharacterized protein n=1 Tax=Labilithrix luteola TaxID=1391654 RepID=A0A0K1QE94_9BACT|nr:hypothetical protein AKJ09_10754 [Labilithrix luteola]
MTYEGRSEQLLLRPSCFASLFLGVLADARPSTQPALRDS